MDEQTLRALLHDLQTGATDMDTVLETLKRLPGEQTRFACLDHHRNLRTGIPEAVFAENKDPEQLLDILSLLMRRPQVVLATRVAPSKADRILERIEGLRYHARAQVLIGNEEAIRPRSSRGPITLVSAGTSDLPVLEEARLTLHCLGLAAQCVTDAGVAGLHRILAHQELLQNSAAIIVAAGMEGALPSVVAGLTTAPVIGLPTSVGYGTGRGGVAALLGMLNSCAPGLAVVNIDNGFGAACMAAAIAAPL